MTPYFFPSSNRRSKDLMESGVVLCDEEVEPELASCMMRGLVAAVDIKKYEDDEVVKEEDSAGDVAGDESVVTEFKFELPSAEGVEDVNWGNLNVVGAMEYRSVGDADGEG